MKQTKKAPKATAPKLKMPSKTEMDNFTSDLITSLNKEQGDLVAYNLSTDVSPTHVKRWIPTGCKGLDYIVSNRRDGGLPEGRIIEIYGPPSIGKSHVAAQICRGAQSMGGIAVYIDTENAVSVENLAALGVDISKRFVYISQHCTEHVLAITESTILKARGLQKNVPVVIVWDSVAGSSPKAELEGTYDQESMGLQARVISKGMRKITGVIGDQNILFVILNQVRSKIGVNYGDPTTTPGGSAIPFHASVRIKLGAGSPILNKDKEPIGINVSAKTIKNRLSAPFRTANFQIHFGVGIKEHEELFDLLRKNGAAVVGDHVIEVSGEGPWKALKVFNMKDVTAEDMTNLEKSKATPIIERKFYKTDFDKIIADPEAAPYIEDLLEKALVRVRVMEPDIDPEAYDEVSALVADMKDAMGDIDPEE